jgi:hypothetical protein
MDSRPTEESGPLSEKVFSERGFSDYGAMERCEGLRQSRRGDPDDSPLPQAPNAIPIPQLAPLLDLPMTSHQSLTT